MRKKENSLDKVGDPRILLCVEHAAEHRALDGAGVVLALVVVVDDLVEDGEQLLPVEPHPLHGGAVDVQTGLVLGLRGLRGGSAGRTDS